MSKYEVFEDAASEWRWRLVADNGEIVAQSEAYSTESNAKRGLVDAMEASNEAQSLWAEAVNDPSGNATQVPRDEL